METRQDKINYYLNIAESVLERSTCNRRLFGAVIVKNDEIVSTGYNGSPRGRRNCNDKGFCLREKLGVVRGQRYELCCAVHAEANAIISASRYDMIGSSLFLVGKEKSSMEYTKDISCCSMCKRLVINAGIKEVYCRTSDNEWKYIDVEKDWVNDWCDEFDINGY